MREIFLKLAPLAVVLSILAAMFGGCSPVVDTKTVMLDYLKQKYGEEFIAHSYSGPTWAYGYYSISASPVGKGGQIISVQGNKDKEGKFVCHDNYFEYIIRDEYEKAMSDILRQYFTEFKLYMVIGSGMCADNLNYDTRVEDIYEKDPKFSADFNLFIKKSDTQNKNMYDILGNIAQDRVNNKMVSVLNFWNALDVKYDLITREKWYDPIDVWVEPTIAFYVKSDLSISIYDDNKTRGR